MYPVQSIVCVSLQLLSHFSKSKKTLETAWFGVSSLSLSLSQSLVSQLRRGKGFIDGTRLIFSSSFIFFRRSSSDQSIWSANTGRPHTHTHTHTLHFTTTTTTTSSILPVCPAFPPPALHSLLLTCLTLCTAYYPHSPPQIFPTSHFTKRCATSSGRLPGFLKSNSTLLDFGYSLGYWFGYFLGYFSFYF